MKMIYYIKIPNDEMKYDQIGEMVFDIKKNDNFFQISSQTTLLNSCVEYAEVIVDINHNPQKSFLKKTINEEKITLYAEYFENKIVLQAETNRKIYNKELYPSNKVIDSIQLFEYVKRLILKNILKSEISILFLDLGRVLDFIINIKKDEDNMLYIVNLCTVQKEEQKYSLIFDSTPILQLNRVVMSGYILELK